MKAVVLNKIGSIKNLEYRSVATPRINKGEVIIKVEYCGVNHLDLLIIAGKRKTSGRFPLIIGSEIVGTRLDNNQRIVVYPWTYCAKCNHCKEGQQNMCDKGGTFGRTRNGGYAEYVSVPKRNLINLPRGIDEKLISAAALSATTALHMIKRAKIPDKTTVLINAATGGVGTAAIQILKYKKCRVLATTSHREKINKLKRLGAEAVNHIPDNIPFIIDTMGGRVWTESLSHLGKNGTIIFCATTLDEAGSVNIGQAFAKQLNILGSYGGTIEDLGEIIKMVEAGIFKPVIDALFNLPDTAKALHRLEKQISFGKILIKV